MFYNVGCSELRGTSFCDPLKEEGARWVFVVSAYFTVSHLFVWI
jgi:hypothetical protein